MSKIFVYGSLMSEGRYHQHYMGGKAFLGKGYLNGYKKYILGGGLDGIAPHEGERMPGEVYEVDQAALSKLGFLLNDSLFTRCPVDVVMENGETVEAEAYVWNGSVC